MSDQMNEFDQIFHDRLSNQTATPPPAVWDNIQSTRTFGHVIANKISTNWRIFGTLLMLLLAGGSSIILLGEEKNQYNYQSININHQNFINSTANKSDFKNTLTTNYKIDNNSSNAINNNVLTSDIAVQGSKAISPVTNAIIKNGDVKQEDIPDVELLASIQQAAFVKPQLEDKRLSAYIQSLDGWEDAKPKGFVRYYKMESLSKLGVYKRELNKVPNRVKIDYDYVLPRVERKTFKERTSILLSITPHNIQKTMRAEYNLSSSFLEDRKKAENTRLAYTFGAVLQYEIKNHKFLESGINFTQIYEEVSFEGEKRFSNQYNFIEVPFLMGFENRNAKWGWQIKGGLGVQIYNSYEGYILKRIDGFSNEPVKDERQYRKSVRNFIKNDHTPSKSQSKNALVDLENENENPYKAAGIVNVHLSTGLVYYHSITTSFIITPSYKRSVNSITKESAKFSEKLTYTGISFGARMKF